nr:maleylpyruvate isomerase N-terminal domain-containing protein [Streptomyces sp. DSM 41633]
MSASDELRANDTRFARVAATLSPGEWAASSLCAEWTNHEVLAHLVIGYSCGIGDFARQLYLRRGFDP